MEEDDDNVTTWCRRSRIYVRIRNIISREVADNINAYLRRESQPARDLRAYVLTDNITFHSLIPILMCAAAHHPWASSQNVSWACVILRNLPEDDFSS